MPSDRIDPELLAAFLDGGLSDEEAGRVRAHLASSPESYQLFMETVASLRELRELESGESTTREVVGSISPAPSISGGVIAAAPPQRAASLRPRWALISVLAAAGIAAVLLIPRNDPTPPEYSTAFRQPAVAKSAANDSVVPRISMASRFGATWNEPGWSRTRGNDAAISAEARAFRSGVRFVEFRTALEWRDTSAVSTARESLNRLLGGFDGGAFVALTVERLADPVRQTGTTPEQVADQIRGLGPSPLWFDLGAWCEAARLAKLRPAADILAEPESSRRDLEALLGRRNELSPPARRLIDEVMAPLSQLATTNPADRATIGRLIDSAVVVGGGIAPR